METYIPDDNSNSCHVQVIRKPEGFESRKVPNTKVKCCWGNEETGQHCINDADVEFNICSGFRVVRHLCEGCLPLVLQEQKLKKKE